MAVQNQDQFESYFRRADLDGDGRISGNEAVSFFQGANLPKPVLAQIWAIADQARTGFLGRQEFFNALKLVTVVQSKRELTPDIVNAALRGPANARIPPPQINLAATPTNQMTPQMGAVGPTASQNTGFRAPGIPNMSMNPSYTPQQIPSMRPPITMPSAPRPNLGMAGPNFPAGGQAQAMPTGFASRPPQVMPVVTPSPGITNPNMSNNWLSARSSATPTELRGVSPSTPSYMSRPQTSVSLSPQPMPNDSKALVVTGNEFTTGSSAGSSTGSFFGSDSFSASQATPKWEPSGPTQSASSVPASVTGYSATGSKPPVKSSSLDSLQSAFSMLPTGAQIQRTQSLQNASQQVSSQSSFSHASLQNASQQVSAQSSFSHASLQNAGQQVSTQSSFSHTSSGISVGAGNSASNNTQPSWPKMKPSDVQKYSKVFMEVDTDRDGRITGEQARNLFLSWRLPREVLKQVWDLSDQDNDSMLSLREFCFALYLMERFREGRPLPETLPSNVLLDETLSSMTGQSNVSYGNAAWGSSPGFGQPDGMGSRPMTPAPGLRPPVPATAPLSDGPAIPNQQKPGAPVLDDSFNNQFVNGEQNDLNFQDAPAEEKKVEKVILDSKEKIEFYRDKMQELVLYRSRCDNRLNEITERAIADKREAESLGKKYEEKYKLVAEIASKLTIEEAKFREIQERKTELHQAILRMEQGGSADGILQVRSDRIQSDLEDLVKALSDRCKKHGLEIKSAAVIELPPGWQPGIQEEAAVWDEDWDKFEDEGFGNEVKVDAKNASVSQNAAAVEGEKTPDGSLTPDSMFHEDEKAENFMMSPHVHTLESESAFTHSDDESARSPHGSPAGGTSLRSPSQDFSEGHSGKSPEADAETHRSFDESTWGAFDNNDDTDSVWGFNANTKDSDFDKHKDLFGSSDFGLNPVRTESPSAESGIFQKKSGFTFDDSVPSTPMSKFGNYSPRYSEAGDHFDSFSRFDSFNDSGFSPQPEKLTRFDSVNSTKDYGRFSFDDSDPFGSSGQFKVSSDNQKKGSDNNWNAF